MKLVKYNTLIECVRGNIVCQPDITAIVNASNSDLVIGGGVAGAIHRAAGPGLADECQTLAPIRPGEAVLTGGHFLPNHYIIHCLGPVYGHDKPEITLLAKCYLNALKLAEENNIDSIAFPAISTGAFGYPVEEAACIAFITIMNRIHKLKNIRKIRFVLYDEEKFDVHLRTLSLFQKPLYKD
jgi:O-acetyl-ADP-ribose deacetylase (regulator of RNase III)